MTHLRNIYKKLKWIPFLGIILVGIRNLIFHPWVMKFILRRRDYNEVIKVIDTFFPNENKALEKLKEFRNSRIFRSKFSFGHSGDYDVMILYILTRLIKPEVVVETGVASGRSSSAILYALSQNNKGQLYSIDLPKYYQDKPKRYQTEENNSELAGFLPPGVKPGWLVPEELCNRWELFLGDSREELPKLLVRLGKIDIFYHDSEHSYQNMMFEFCSIWPKLTKGGYLLSDDIKWNNAYNDFKSKNEISNSYEYRNFGIIGK